MRMSQTPTNYYQRQSWNNHRHLEEDQEEEEVAQNHRLGAGPRKQSVHECGDRNIVIIISKTIIITKRTVDLMIMKGEIQIMTTCINNEDKRQHTNMILVGTLKKTWVIKKKDRPLTLLVVDTSGQIMVFKFLFRHGHWRMKLLQVLKNHKFRVLCLLLIIILLHPTSTIIVSNSNVMGHLHHIYRRYHKRNQINKRWL